MSAFSAATLRGKGNELYLMSTNSSSEGKHHLWKTSKLTEAIRNFEEGKRVASQSGDKVEWLKCARSIGVAYSYLASSEEFPDGNGIDWTVYNFKSALTAFSEIITNYKNIEDKPWQNLVFNKLSSTLSSAIEYCVSNETGWNKRCSLLERFLNLEEVSGASACYTRVHVLISTAEEVVKAIVTADEAGEWRTVLKLVGELNRPLSLARTELSKCHFFLPPLDVELSDLNDRLSEIDSSQQYYWGRGSSQQHRIQGESFFRQMLFNEETLDTELLWICIDHLSTSMQCLRGADNNPETCSCHESFAKSCSALGLVYEKVLKIPEKAHGLYLQTILHCDIVTHTTGAQFFSKEWYQVAKSGVEAHRRRREAFDSAEVERLREPTLAALKPTLTAIDAAIATCQSKMYKGHALMVHIYAKVPPKKSGAVLADPLDRDNKEEMKKAFLKAVTHYHPDKKCNKESGIEWLVLCEEITKRLNEYYEVVK